MGEHGLSEDDYEAVANWKGDERFTDAERAAIDFADRFGRDHLSIDDALWAELRTHWSDAEILDLTVLLASFLGLGRLTQVLDPAISCPLEI